MSCCAPGTESAGELDRIAAQGPGAPEMRMTSRALGDGLFQCDLIVPGVHCGACIALLEKELPRIDGVTRARVNLSTRRIAVTWREDAGEPALAAVSDRLKALGYPAHLPSGGDAEADPVFRTLLKALAVAGFASMNVMLLSVSVWSGAEAATRDLFHWISALIAAPALVYSGRVFFGPAWNALRRGRTNMDVPISLGVLMAYGLSLYETFTHGTHAYFDASVTLLFFLLAGRALDHMMRERARSAVRNLVRLAPRGAQVIETGGGRAWRIIDEIEPGMRIAIAAGDRIPVDARIVSGRSDMDFSLVNGESAPVPVETGSLAPAGTLNMTGALVIEALRPASASFLAEMTAMMEAAESGRAGYRRIADRAASVYAPVVHLLAAFTFIGWMVSSGDWRMAMMTAVSVLIITCPCALGLAVPVVQVIAAGRLFENGIMVKDGSAMERLAEARHAVFDKTGTLTAGRPILQNAGDLDPANLAVAARIASASRHPFAKALAAFDDEGRQLPVFAVEERPGEGLEARAPDGTVWRLGRPAFALGGNVAPRDDGEGSRTVLSRGGKAVATYVFTDRARKDAAQAIADLARSGISSEILSGDREVPVAELARALSIRQWTSGVTPRGKLDRLNVLSGEGRMPLMVGDGLNDAPALAAAHVSMAPASAADAGRMAADFVFLHETLASVPVAIDVSRKAGRLIRQNFALAIAYNMIAVPLAVLGHATPLIAAAAMSSSSVIVVLNSLRLRRRGAVPHGAAMQSDAREVHTRGTTAMAGAAA